MTTRETIVITGASDGIGAAAARQLATADRQVVVVGRSPEKTRAVAESIDAPYHLADFADLSQVRSLADELKDSYPRIDVLAHNAGGVFDNTDRTVDGFELTFQVNHLAGFLLTGLLLPTLIESRASVIQTASFANRAGRIELDDLATSQSASGRAYGNSKLANILFVRELHRRYHFQGVSAVAFHPGVIRSSFAGTRGGLMQWFYQSPLTKPLLESNEIGGQRLAFFAEGVPGQNWQSGEYYERSRVAKANKQAGDPKLAAALWERSAELVDL